MNDLNAVIPQELFLLFYLPIYPGVPLVSLPLSFLYNLAIPKSVNLKNPSLSITKFSGFISLCNILFSAKYSRARIIQAIKNSFL